MNCMITDRIVSHKSRQSSWLCIYLVACLCVLIVTTQNIYAVSPVLSETKFYAFDAQKSDNFGETISVEGDLALLGTFFNDPGGRAHLIDISDFMNPVHLVQFAGADTERNDHFGSDVAIAGNIALIGASYRSRDPQNPSLDDGAVYLFDISDPINPIELSIITSPATVNQNNLGSTITIHENMALIGAGDAGHLYDISDPTNPIKLSTIENSKVITHSLSSWHISENNIVFEGAPAYYNSSTGDFPGAVVLYDISNPTSPVELSHLIPSDGGTRQYFGANILIKDNIAYVASPFISDEGDRADSSVYLFDVSDPLNPVEITKVVPSDGDGFTTTFGQELSIRGNVMAVGSGGTDFADKGSVYLYDISNPKVPVEIAIINASDAQSGDHFGSAVAFLTDNKLLIGAHGDGDIARTAGAAYIIELRPLPTLITYTNFSEPAIGASSFTPSPEAEELGFTTVGNTNNGANPGIRTANTSSTPSSPIFFHRSVDATTTFDTVELGDWTDVEVQIKIQARDAGYENSDFLHIYVTDGTEQIDLVSFRGISSAPDALEAFADGGYEVFSAEIPDYWTEATLIISSSSNSSTGSERYDFDDIRFIGVVAVPEPPSLILLAFGLLGIVALRFR